MEKKAEQLKDIDARIRELENSIRQREDQLKNRAGHFREEIKAGLAPEEIVRKYPFQAAGGSLLVGFLTARFLRSVVSPSSPRKTQPPEKDQQKPSEIRHALGSLGIDVLHSGKDLAFSYLKHYLDRKVGSHKT